jgi:hypothetical protein
LKVVERFRDNRYLLVKVLWEGKEFVYLYDRKQDSHGLCLAEGAINLKELWEKHKSDDNYCLPCELFLLFSSKFLQAKSSIAELGISKEVFERFKKELKEAL